MADEKSDSPSVVIAGKIDHTGAEGRIELTTVDKLLRLLRPGTYREQEAFDVMIEGVRRKQASGEALSPIEATVLAATLEPVLRKAKNVRKVIDFALEEQPALAQLVSPMTPVLGSTLSGVPAPLALPVASGTTTGDSIDVDFTETIEQQETLYFWDRFWADAEVVSVEHIQRIYGKIAARKATNQRAVSLHTLEVIRCLESRTLANFEKLSAYVFSSASAPSWNPFKEEYERAGLAFADILEFEEARLVTMTDLLGPFSRMRLGNGIVRVRSDDGETEGALGEALPPIIGLTQAGHDLIGLKRQKPDQTQVAAMLKFLAVHGGKRLEWSPDGKAPFEPVEGEPTLAARMRTAKPDNKDPFALLPKSKPR
jgi:hypothetical protein